MCIPTFSFSRTEYFHRVELHNTQHTTLSIDRLVFPAETNQFWAVAEFNMAALLPARWPSSPLALTRILYRHSHSHGWDSIQTHSTRTGQQHTQQPHTSAKFLIRIFRRCLFLSDRFDYLQLRLMLIIFIFFSRSFEALLFFYPFFLTDISIRIEEIVLQLFLAFVYIYITCIRWLVTLSMCAAQLKSGTVEVWLATLFKYTPKALRNLSASSIPNCVVEGPFWEVLRWWRYDIRLFMRFMRSLYILSDWFLCL